MIRLKIPRFYVEAGVSVILRVPALFIVDIWSRSDPLKMVSVSSRDEEMIVTISFYLALFLAIALATLPLRKLVLFYMYLVSGLLLVVAYHLSNQYVEGEKSGISGDEAPSVLENPESLQRLALHLGAQCFIAAFIAYLADITDWTKFTMLVFAAPVVARMAGLPIRDLSAVHNFSTIFITLIILLYIFNNLGYILDIAKEGVNYALAAGREFGWTPFLATCWHALMLPAQLLLFWFFLFSSRLFVYFYSGNHPILQEGWIIVILASVGECCATPVSLLALCVTISYASYAILTLTKLYLMGWDAFMQDNNPMRGWTEGFTMLLIAIQTGILDLRPLQRAFLMSILLFIVTSSLIQSMLEITDPILLALSASHNKSKFKHLRAVGMCTFLWMFPLYMTYCICQYFDLDFWLMVIVSSCMLTSVQVIGSLVVYALFMYDSIREEPWESLDDVIYYARSVVRIMEFVVAVYVVFYGIKESLFGEWSWINASILIIHCYFNVWQRLQSGWKSFLLRREAVKRIESLPSATDEQLTLLNDVCAICFQEMRTAKVTHCGHFFHATCLRKWLYVKEACPMCHKLIDSPPGDGNHETGEGHEDEDEDGSDSESGVDIDNHVDDYEDAAEQHSD